MRIGIICEGGPVTNVRNATTDNPDARVLERCINLLSPGHTFEFIPLGNKPTLKRECGIVAARLLEVHGCDVIFVCWDLYPAWSTTNQRPCLAKDRTEVLDALRRARIEHPHVYLLCVEAEIETILLCDERALSAVLSTRTHPVAIRRGVGDGGNNPKGALARLFNTYGHRYNPPVHNPLIARAIPDIVRIRRNPSFARLMEKLRLAGVIT